MAAVIRSLAAVAITMALAGSAFLAAAPADAADLTPAGQEGMNQIATCLRSNPNLVALLVVDESGSLQDTDPKNVRAQVLADLVTSLSQLSGQETPAGPRKVEFAVNTFAMDSTPLVPWTSLDQANASTISDQLRSTLPGLNQGGGTNYVRALKDARSTLSAGVAKVQAEVPPCKIAIWFTDGVLNISDNPAENEQSAAELCASDGPVEALRQSGVNLISVLLHDTDLDAHLAEADRELFRKGIPLLQSTAEGSAGSGKYAAECGTVPVPDADAKGAYFEGNVDALAGQFTAAIALGSGATSLSGLKGSPVTFTIDAGISEFWVSALAPDGFTLAGPEGQTLSAKSGQPATGTPQATTTWTGPALKLQVPVSKAQVGTWTLTRPGMTDDVQVYLFSNYKLALDSSDLIADEPATVTGHVLNPDGTPADLSSFRDVNLAVTQYVDGKQVDPVPFTINRQDGTFTGDFTPQTTSSEVKFDVVLDLTTNSGFPLSPLATSFVKSVKLPGAYPQVAASSLSLGSIQHRGDIATVPLQIVGSPDGSTKVCVVSTALTTDVPAAAVALQTTPSTGCQDVAANQTITIDVSASIQNGVTEGGEFAGQLELALTNAPTAGLEPRERKLTVPLSGQVVPLGPVWWVPVVLTFLGVLIPLLVLYFVNWRAARLRLEGIMMARVPVEVRSDGSLARTDQPGNPLVTHQDFSFVAASARTRTWTPSGAETLRAKSSPSPFGSVTARVEAPVGQAVISNTAPTTAEGGARAGIGLNPSMSAYLLLNKDDLRSTGEQDPVPAELVAFLVPKDLAPDCTRLSSEISTFDGWGTGVSMVRTNANAVRWERSKPVRSVDPPAASETAALPDDAPPAARPKVDRFGLGSDPGNGGPGPAVQPLPPDASPPSGNRFSL